MGWTWRDDPCTPERIERAITTMRASVEAGATCWNGGEFYGDLEYNSLHLLREYFTRYPEDADKVVINIKGCGGLPMAGPDGSEKEVRRSIDNTLSFLEGKKKLDLFEPARVDPKTPMEETISYMAKYVKEGKLEGISLSECSANTIRRAAKVHKISGVEIEFSLFSTDILENGVAEACADLNIPIFAYSPLGRGMLTGQIKKQSDVTGRLAHMPRFQPPYFEENLKLAKEVEKIAETKGCTPGQIALAWVKSFSGKKGMPTIIPIPGATSTERMLENTKEVTLSEKDMKDLAEILQRCEVKGGRYPEGFLASLEWG
ncbi:MAG: Pyridoxine 4-dehydrogenase [Alyxoria varia]|nr:MAG: Pyridoxine 4-dehydrogenase [Alyxoria varia]